jgi:hypothetical protein
MLQTSRSWVWFPMMPLEFFSDIFLPVALWPQGQLSLFQKWVPGVLPGGKGGRCIRLTTLPPSCAIVMKSGNFNFLEPSGPLQACNGTALPLGLTVVQWLRHYTTNRQVAGSIPDGVIGIFQWQSHYGPGVNSASNRNEYQVYFLGVKAAGA